MRTKIISIKNNPATFYILVSSIFISMGFYMFFVNSAVRNAVARGDSESDILVLENRVSDLEYRYMLKQKAITLDSAKGFGLSEPENKVFISFNSNILE